MGDGAPRRSCRRKRGRKDSAENPCDDLSDGQDAEPPKMTRDREALSTLWVGRCVCPSPSRPGEALPKFLAELRTLIIKKLRRQVNIRKYTKKNIIVFLPQTRKNNEREVTAGGIKDSQAKNIAERTNWKAFFQWNFQIVGGNMKKIPHI